MTDQLVLLVAFSPILIALVALVIWRLMGSTEHDDDVGATARAEVRLHEARSRIMRTLVKGEIRATSIRMRRELDRELTHFGHRPGVARPWSAWPGEKPTNT